jgi:hypothetical protein
MQWGKGGGEATLEDISLALEPDPDSAVLGGPNTALDECMRAKGASEEGDRP